MEGCDRVRAFTAQDGGVDLVRHPFGEGRRQGFPSASIGGGRGLVVLCDLDKKEALLRSGDPAFYTTPHYDGYPAILVNLKKITRAALKELITESWRRKAPLRLLREFDGVARVTPDRPRRR